ncbi:MAG: MMPL family transporter [Ferrimicrobium sp.]
MSKLFEGLGRLSVRFRYFVVVVWVVALVAAVSFLPSLSSVIQNNFANFLPKNSPSIAAANLANSFQKSSDTIVVAVVYRPSGALSSADGTYVTGLANALSHVPTVIRSSVAAVSQSGQAEQIEVLSSVSQFDKAGVASFVSSIQSVVHRSPPPASVEVHLAGAAVTSVAQASQNGTSASSTQLYSVLFIFLLLLVVFRSILAPFLTLIPAFLVTVLAGPIVARLTTVLNFQVSSTTQLLMIVLVLGAGTDYGLFLVFRTREEIRRGRSGREAVEYALARVGESITFSAFTVIAAVLSLITATFGFYNGLGFPLAIAVFLMLLAGLTLQPALLAIFGRAAFWPSRVRQTQSVRFGLWGRTAGALVRRPVITLLLGVVFFGVLAIFAVGNKPSGFASATTAPAKSDAYYGNAALAKYFPKSTYNPTELVVRFSTPIWSHLADLSTMQSVIEGSPLFKQVNGALNPAGVQLSPSLLASLHARLGPASLVPQVQSTPGIPPQLYQKYRATANYISVSGKTVLFGVTLSAGDPGLTPALNAVPAIRAFTSNLAHRVGAVKSGVAGEAPASHDISASSNHDLVRIVPLVILVIAVLLALVLRSLVAPLFLVVSVAISYFAALGLDVIIFMKFGNNSGLSFILPFLLFLFILALGEDYNILVMTRIREECHRLPIKDAVIEAIGATGGTVTAAGMVLAGTFLVLGLASGGQAQVEEIGIGLAAGVLMDTFLVRTLLVPATVVLLDRWTWWPSKLHMDLVSTDTGDDDSNGFDVACDSAGLPV